MNTRTEETERDPIAESDKQREDAQNRESVNLSEIESGYGSDPIRVVY